MPCGLRYYTEDMPMKYRIMVKILMTLLAKRKITAKEIADRYEISLRTVYRYIEELSISGIPIDIERGRYGGIKISDAYKLPAGYFTREEYNSAINALRAWSAQVNDDATISALEKIERQQKNDKRELAVCADIIVDGDNWGDAGVFTEKMKTCEKAVNECTSVTIDYISRSGEHSRRTIDPYVLILKRNVWYLYAFCHTKQDFRTFKIGRIRKIWLTDRKFTKKPITRDQIPLDFYYSSDQLTSVTLSIERSALSDAEEWLGVDAIEPRGDKLICEMQLPAEGLVNKILSFGGAVKVVSPQSLADEVRQAARRFID